MDNKTAKVSCFARAYHHKNNQVRIFGDDKAEKMLGEEYEQIAQHMKNGISFFLPDYQGDSEEGLRLIVDRQLSPSVLGRSAYCETMLENEKRLGCRQYLIFAAGYDTFAMRNTDTALSVFELDHPDVLTDKRKRIKIAKEKVNAVYVPCDLSKAEWKEKLMQSGFKADVKSFGSLLGISYYLRKEEFKELLKSLNSLLVEGSAICFDYPSLDEGVEAKTNQKLAQGAGEEMKALYSYREMEALLDESGFLIYEHLEHDEMTSRFFSGYNRCNPERAMEAPRGVCYVLAVSGKAGEENVTR